MVTQVEKLEWKALLFWNMIYLFFALLNFNRKQEKWNLRAADRDMKINCVGKGTGRIESYHCRGNSRISENVWLSRQEKWKHWRPNIDPWTVAGLSEEREKTDKERQEKNQVK